MKIIVKLFFTLLLLLSCSFSSAAKIDLIQKTRDLLSDKQALYDAIYQATGNKLQTEKIVGGSFANRGEYQEYSLILLYNSLGNLESICGGTLIANNKVLTAAHCVFERLNSNILVIPGFYSFNDDPDIYNIFALNNKVIHPGYNDNIGNGFDISILTLNSNSNTRKAQIYAGSSTLAGTNSNIIGHGRTSANSDISATLKKAFVPVVSNAICQNSNTGSGITIKNHMLCAGLFQGGTGTCPGDSGGPLFVTLSGQRVQAALTSFGIPCANANSYDVYTRLSSFVNFIRTHSPNTKFVFDPPATNDFIIPPILMLLED